MITSECINRTLDVAPYPWLLIILGLGVAAFVFGLLVQRPP